MESDPPATVPCPHCQQPIRPAARICRHCRRELVPAQLPTGAGLPVVGELRTFLVGSNAVTPDVVDEMIARTSPRDADHALAELARAGHITDVQVESLRATFGEQQRRRLRALLDAGVARGLLLAAHVDRAITAFEPASFTTTPDDYLVEAGLLTRAQLASSAQAAPPAASASGRFFAGATSRAALAVGPGAMLVVVPLALVLGRAVGPTQDWVTIPLLFAPIVAVVLLLWRRARPIRRVAWAGGTFAFGLLTLAVAVKLGIGAPPPRVAVIEPHCTMDGRGEGTCVFTNTDLDVGVSCGQIVAQCTPRRGTSDSRTSEPICSGPVRPGQTRRVAFTVAEFDRVRDRAVPLYGDWRSFCSFEWEAR